MESESLAFESEKALIELFGRKDNGTGILLNKSDGGDGASPSAETRKRISTTLRAKGQLFKAIVSSIPRPLRVTTPEGKESFRQKRKTWNSGAGNKGKKHSREHRASQSEASKRLWADASHRVKMSAAHKGKAWSAARRAAYETRFVKAA